MLGAPGEREGVINRGFGAPSGSYPQDRGRASLGALIFFLSLLFLSASFALPSAGATPSDGGVTASVHLSDSGRIEVHAVWNGEFSGDLGVKEADWSARLSSPATGKLKLGLGVSATLSDRGIQWLSERGAGGISLLDLLPLADGDPSLVEELVMNKWEGRRISKIRWANLIPRIAPDPAGNRISSLTIEKIDCEKFSWDEPRLDIRLTLELWGSIVHNRRAVGDPPLNVTGTLKVSKPGWTGTADASFQVSTTGKEWSWNFAVPHIQTIYGREEYEGFTQRFSNERAKLTLNSAKKADTSDIPEGYEKKGQTYTWAGGGAVNGIVALLTGEGEYSVSYSEAPPEPSPPVADADGPYSVDEGKSISLDGTGRSGQDGSIESYSWTIIDGSGSLEDSNTAEPTYVAPEVESDTDVTVKLTVADDGGVTSIDTAGITVKNVKKPSLWPIVVGVIVIAAVILTGAWYWRSREKSSERSGGLQSGGSKQ